MDKFNDEQKRYIVMRLACFASPSQVVKEVLDLYEMPSSIARIMFYDPNTAQGNARLDTELKQLFADTRAAYKSRVEDIPIATQVGRITRLQEQLDYCERNPVLAKDILKQAAMEMGGMFTNRREITGANGKPIVPDAGARNEAGKELDAWRKVKNDELAQTMNAPE